MENNFLHQETLNKIKSDPVLFGSVAKELNIAPTSLMRLIYSRDKRLTQYGVLVVISDHLKIPTAFLLEENKKAPL